jgi:hypothetical protein
MMKKITISAFLLVLIAIANIASAAYSAPDKIVSVESQGADVAIYTEGSMGNPAGCSAGSNNTQAFLNNDEGLQRSYSAALAALASNRDVQLLVSSGACRYNKPVIIGIRVN